MGNPRASNAEVAADAANATGEAHVQLPLTGAVGKGTLTIDGSHLRHKFRDVAFAGGDVYSVTS